MTEQNINVLIGWDLRSDLMTRIADFDPRVRLLNQEIPPFTAPTGLWPPFPDELLSQLPETEILLTLRVPRDLFDRAPNLRWIQSQAAGVDAIVSRRLLESTVVVTTASGVQVIPLAESALGGIIALAKQLPQAVRNQVSHEWHRYVPDELQGATVGIVGAGKIGSRLAELCAALGMHVLGIRRSINKEQRSESPFDLLLPPSALDRLLLESDYVVLVLPRTPETVGLIGRQQLQRMKLGARLINIGRGDVLDEDALVESLQAGHLAGAYLDVFRTEPLPSDSPFWDMPNVLITPHSAAAAPRREERIVDIFLDNLRRYLDGQPLNNVFQRDQGY